MVEVRFHGRGGQGAVVACDILACGLLKEGKFAQYFPLFGGERRGAPVQAFLRISDTPVMARGQIYEPDHVVVLDPTLVTMADAAVLTGLKKGGWLVINTTREPASFGLADFRVATVDASGLVAKLGLGSRQARPVNTAILGAFARATRLIGLQSVLEAIAEGVPAQREENIAAAREAYAVTKFSDEGNDGR